MGPVVRHVTEGLKARLRALVEERYPEEFALDMARRYWRTFLIALAHDIAPAWPVSCPKRPVDETWLAVIRDTDKGALWLAITTIDRKQYLTWAHEGPEERAFMAPVERIWFHYDDLLERLITFHDKGAQNAQAKDPPQA